MHRLLNPAKMFRKRGLDENYRVQIWFIYVETYYNERLDR